MYPPELSQALIALSRQETVTLFMTLLSWRSKALDFSVARGDYEVLKGDSEAKIKIGATQTHAH